MARVGMVRGGHWPFQQERRSRAAARRKRSGWGPVVSSPRKRERGGKGDSTMANLLWTIIVILVVLWLIGLLAHFGGSLIHLLIVIAVILFIINLVTGRRVV
jgi:Flp pilus assembly protein TadB